MLPEPMTPPSLPRTGSLRLRSGQAGQVREDGAPGKSKNVREIPHPPRRVRNDKEQRLDSGGWKSEIRDRRLEERGWGAGCTQERAQIRVRQPG